MDGIVKVFILTTCLAPENLDKTLMVFKTVRVGFPTADISVVDNASYASCVPDIEDAAHSVGASFHRLAERTEHGKFMAGVVERGHTLGNHSKIAFVDTDMVFWENCEDIDMGGALFGGRFIPRIETADAVHIARIHPSFLLISDVAQLHAEIEGVSHTWWTSQEFKPFEAHCYVDNGKAVFVDACATLTGAMAYCAYAFGPNELNRYDHLFLGTIPHMVGKLSLPEDIQGVISAGHALERLEDMKGLWRQQNGRNFEWCYMSGRAAHFGFMTARFKEPTTGYEIGHVCIVDTANGRILFAGPATKIVGDTFVFPDGHLTLSVRDTCRAIEHGVVPLEETGWALHRSWPSASVDIVSAVVDGKRLGNAMGIEFWIDYETGFLPSRKGWVWASIRLNDGKKLMLYERSGRKELWEFDDTLAIPVEYERHERAVSFDGRTIFLAPVIPNQQVVDPFHSLVYEEALCDVIEDGETIGYAYLETVPDNWGDPRFSVSEWDMHLRWANGDPAAAELLSLFGKGSQLADDIADQGIPADELSEAVMTLMGDMIVRLPNNPFYAKHRATLEPVLMSSFLIWDATNDWCKSPKRETQMFAYTFREILGQVIGMVALLVGGLAFARRVTREVHLYYHSNRVESFDMWRKELGHG